MNPEVVEVTLADYTTVIAALRRRCELVSPSWRVIWGDPGSPDAWEDVHRWTVRCSGWHVARVDLFGRVRAYSSIRWQQEIVEFFHACNIPTYKDKDNEINFVNDTGRGLFCTDLRNYGVDVRGWLDLRPTKEDAL